ncbi:hypothetical protein D0B54_00795 [Solimonas sp. K1W22B-7]|nr:hypothetical protein D0B54_00795 [Solimonas sp. K1W22B-7]
MSGAAVAGPYLGGSVALTERASYEDVERANGGKFVAGYRFDNTPLMLEVNYLDAGDAEIENTGGVELGYSGITALIGYWAKGSDLGSGFWLAGGFYSGDAELSDPSGLLGIPGATYEDSASGVAISLGGVWKFTRYVGLQFSLDGLLGVTDFADDENLTAYTLGLVIELPGGSRSSSGPKAQNSAYTPTYAPAPVPAPAPAAELTPAPAPVVAPVIEAPVAAEAAEAPPTIKPNLPGGMAAIGVRRTAQPTMLLRQPRAGAPVDGNIPGDAEVQLLQRVPNAQGVWWYVSFNGSSGWVSESALK